MADATLRRARAWEMRACLGQAGGAGCNEDIEEQVMASYGAWLWSGAIIGQCARARIQNFLPDFSVQSPQRPRSFAVGRDFFAMGGRAVQIGRW